MKHLEFTDKLNELGCSFTNTNIEGKVKVIEIPNLLSDSDYVEIKNFHCSYIKTNSFSQLTPLQSIIKKAIDIGEWKHSRHNDLEFENYEKFKEIIQDEIIDRSRDIDLLLTVYFQIKYELSKE